MSSSAAKASVNLDDGSADNISSSSSSTNNNENAIILSLYLIQSEEDILHPSVTSNVHERANLYKRLCEACLIANKTLRSASSSTTQPFQAGGDGPIFGVHCNVDNDDLLARNEFDADELWQSQGMDEQSKDDDDDDRDDADNQISTSKLAVDTFQQPHLRAIFRYGNDINDMWRCISLMLQITTDLANANLSCAVECWDLNDGHILLIEAAEHLPSWVDDDVLQGGVGGPEGTHNRCWIVDGKVHLIPPTNKSKRDPSSMKNKKVDLLSRREALIELVDAFHKDPDGSSTLAPTSVQHAIEHRINRTDYWNNSDESRVNTSNSHWHVAAAALPASVAYFIQKHPSLVPLIIDSFCENAPKYLKQRKRKRKKAPEETSEGTVATDEQTPSMQQQGNNQRDALGILFPFEQVVTIPITMTRANYAELVTGRGTVPAFPVPREYRSVELKRFHRQLGQTALGRLDNDDKNRNPFERAVDVGVRLCAGLEWIVACSEQIDKAISDCKDDVHLNSLGDVERRLRLFWTRIDAEASVDFIQHDCEEDETNHWIERAWQAGPMNSNHHLQCDKMLLSALESMSKCRVFNPELSKSSQEEPCPITKPRMSLRGMTQAGMKNALKWQREEYDESHFPIPKLCQLDSDAWMEIKSMEALEEEMKNLSSETTKTDTNKSESKGPRRTTRRSRRNLNTNTVDEQGDETTNRDTLNKMASGFRAFVEGHGDVEGIAATPEEDIMLPIESIESLMSQDVNIKPRAFLDVLQSMLRDQHGPSSSSSVEIKSKDSPSTPVEPDISSFFFQEDLNYESGDDSDVGVEANINLMQESKIIPDDDPFSLKNIMQAMDYELRTDVSSDPSIKNLSVAMEDDLDDEAMANLLRSMEASEGAGPARNMLLGMGIPLPRPTTD